MKLAVVFSFIFSTVSFLSFAQTTTLEDFRTGTFAYENMGEEIQIIRTEDTQTEIYNNGSSQLILSIEWESDVRYVLTMKKGINAEGCLKKGDKIHTTILSHEGNVYKAYYTSKRCGEGESNFVKLKD